MTRNLSANACLRQWLRQWLRERTKTYANKPQMTRPSIATESVGVQKRNSLGSLCTRRLAAKNTAKNRTARTQNAGEWSLSNSPRTFRPNPDARPSSIPLMIIGTARRVGRRSESNVAANALRTTLVHCMSAIQGRAGFHWSASGVLFRLIKPGQNGSR